MNKKTLNEPEYSEKIFGEAQTLSTFNDKHLKILTLCGYLCREIPSKMEQSREGV